MSEAERYLARAEQLERLARELKDPAQRLQLLDIAADWRSMAERARDEERRTWAPRTVRQSG